MNLIQAINNKLSDDIASCENHCMDNSFLDFDYEYTEMRMIRDNYEPIGICSPPYSSKTNIAFVYEDKEFNKHWCHVTKDILEQWMKQIDEDSKESIKK